MIKVPKHEITNYLPQRDPFIMVDNLIDAYENKIETNFYISPHNIFVENGILREFALIENIAQSSAIGLNFLVSTRNNLPSDGFIGAISKLVVYDIARVDETIDTTVYLKAAWGNLYLLKGESFVGAKKIFECEIKLAGKE